MGLNTRCWSHRRAELFISYLFKNTLITMAMNNAIPTIVKKPTPPALGHRSDLAKPLSEILISAGKTPELSTFVNSCASSLVKFP